MSNAVVSRVFSHRVSALFVSRLMFLRPVDERSNIRSVLRFLWLLEICVLGGQHLP